MNWKFQFTNEVISSNSSNYDLSGNENNLNLFYEDPAMNYGLLNSTSEISGNEVDNAIVISKIDNDLSNYTNDGIMYDYSNNFVKKTIIESGNTNKYACTKSEFIIIFIEKNVIYNFGNETKLYFSYGEDDMIENMVIDGNYFFICGSLKSQSSINNGAFTGLNPSSANVELIILKI